MDADTEFVLREKIMSRIEGFCGTLDSLPYHQISTTDLLKLANQVCFRNYPNGIPEYWIYLNQ